MRKIVAWLEKSDELRLKEANSANLEIKYVYSLNECAAEITAAENPFIVLSLKFFKFDDSPAASLLNQFPHHMFYMFAIYDEIMTIPEWNIFDLPNVYKVAYLVEDIISMNAHVIRF